MKGCGMGGGEELEELERQRKERRVRGSRRNEKELEESLRINGREEDIS